MDNHLFSCHQLGRIYKIDEKQVRQQYKTHISNYNSWNQRDHIVEWMLFEKNLGSHLSIDETALSNDELYIIVTNKAAKGGKGTIVAVIRSKQSDKVTTALMRPPEKARK